METRGVGDDGEPDDGGGDSGVVGFGGGVVAWQSECGCPQVEVVELVGE